MAQQVINVGTSANDGQGDPIRTAFIKCNNNFTELFTRFQTDPPSTSTGAPGDVAGMFAADGVYFYFCVADYDDTTIIWQRVAWDTTPW